MEEKKYNFGGRAQPGGQEVGLVLNKLVNQTKLD